MSGMKRHRLAAIALMTGASVFAGLCGVAGAAVPDAPGPISNPDKPYMAYVIGLVLAACVCAVAFKPSKRTHLD